VRLGSAGPYPQGVQATFTKLVCSRDGAGRYGVDVTRETAAPARLRVQARSFEVVPREIAHFVVERDFGLRLAVFGQLAAGGDAGMFWAAPTDRSPRSAALAHRLCVTGRGDVGRAVALVAMCTAEWERQAGRRPAPLAGPWPLLDATEIRADVLARAVGSLAAAAASWQLLTPGESLTLRWPTSLTFPRRRSA
jgi:hypothetical protein